MSHEVLALDNISFTVRSGEVLGIVGESGSGKSTIALSILGLINRIGGKVVCGTIEFCKKQETIDLLKIPDEKMVKIRGERISLIFQDALHSFNPIKRIGPQIVEAYRQKDSKILKKQHILELFAQVQLSAPERIYKSYPHELSGGQLQRAMIAMSLVNHPEILIADEPTTGLDTSIQKRIIELLKGLKNQWNWSMLFISHDLGLISEVADRVIVMRKGRIVESGTVSKIFKNPENPYTKGLIACRPPLDKKIRRLPVLSDFEEISKDSEKISKDSEKMEWQIDNSLQNRIEELKGKRNILEISNLSKWFPSTKGIFGQIRDYTVAVDDISFILKQGEILGLVGESGSGKSTLAKLLLRLIQPTGGKVYYQGKDLFQMSDKEFNSHKKNIQIIFQNPYASLDPRQTVGSAIEEAMTIHSNIRGKNQLRNEAIGLLELVGLEADHYVRFPHALSGGQKQRVCIARILAVKPELVIYDEPVSSVDVSIQARILNLLKDLKEQFDLSYIFISHDLSVIHFMSDNIMVMKEGQIVEYGASHQIYSAPKAEYTKELLSSIPGQSI